jgi:hypothetical protein
MPFRSSFKFVPGKWTAPVINFSRTFPRTTRVSEELIGHIKYPQDWIRLGSTNRVRVMHNIGSHAQHICNWNIEEAKKNREW